MTDTGSRISTLLNTGVELEYAEVDQIVSTP